MQNEFYPSAHPVWACEVCTNTLATNAYNWPAQYEGQSDTLKAVSWTTNRILDQMNCFLILPYSDGSIEVVPNVVQQQKTVLYRLAQLRAKEHGRQELADVRKALDIDKSN